MILHIRIFFRRTHFTVNFIHECTILIAIRNVAGCLVAMLPHLVVLITNQLITHKKQ